MAKETVVVHSSEEDDKLVKEGYVIVSTAQFVSGDGTSYTLEKGSEWSKNLGSE